MVSEPGHFLPEWTTERFVVLDNRQRWAAAISREIAHIKQEQTSCKGVTVRLETSSTARDVLLGCELRNTAGLILFVDELEKECLSILGGLARRHQSLPILAVLEQKHRELMPVMMESGVDTVLYDVVDDVPLASWCVRVLASQNRMHVSSSSQNNR